MKGYSSVVYFYDAVHTLQTGSHLFETCKHVVIKMMLTVHFNLSICMNIYERFY